MQGQAPRESPSSNCSHQGLIPRPDSALPWAGPLPMTTRLSVKDSLYGYPTRASTGAGIAPSRYVFSAPTTSRRIGRPVKTILRRLRGALGNALVWGGLWFVGTFVLYVGLIVLAGNGTPFEVDVQWILLKICGIHGVVGFITGGAFSAYVAGTYRVRRIEDLSPTRCALGGARVAIPIGILFRIWLRYESGWGLLPLHEVTRPMVIAAVFGGLTG